MAGLFKGVSKYIENHFGNQSTDQSEVRRDDETQNDIGYYDNELSYSMNESGQGVRVHNGVIEVKGYGNIIPCNGIELYINDKLCTGMDFYEVDESDKVEYKILQKDESREINAEISKDKMHGFVSIQYNGGGERFLKDDYWSDCLILKCGTILNGDFEKYNMFDVKNILKKNNIVMGIDEEKLKEVCEKGTDGQLVEIACGSEAVDDIPSKVEILFDLGDKDNEAENTIKKIDYKNVYSIVNVEVGDTLAEIIPSIDGCDGYDVMGEVKKRKISKNKPVKVGYGCKIQENNIIATKNGRPSSKNGVVNVNSVYKVDCVDIKSGNIKFIGDVEIADGVNEGMVVNAGNSILINKDVDNATVAAGGEINIKGSIINSKVTTGQIDIEKKLYIDDLKSLSKEINNLLNCSEELIERSNKTMNFTEVVKVLVENKFRSISKLSTSLLKKGASLEIENHKVLCFIRDKIKDANISNIKCEHDLLEFDDMIKNEIDFYEDDMIIQSDINISYSQNSMVKSTGKVFITGKGTYVSEIIALNEVEYVQKDAVARGGKISSLKSVHLGIIGSPAGVRTVVEVPEEGIITAEYAYANTQFCFGKKSKVLDSDYKNIKAYIDQYGDIEVEKLFTE